MASELVLRLGAGARDLLRGGDQLLDVRPRGHALEVDRSLRRAEGARIGRTDHLPDGNTLLIPNFQFFLLHRALWGSCFTH